jgi:hypothetical protein
VARERRASIKPKSFMINEFLQYLADVTCLGVVRSFEARVDVE